MDARGPSPASSLVKISGLAAFSSSNPSAGPMDQVAVRLVARRAVRFPAMRSTMARAAARRQDLHETKGTAAIRI